MTNVFFIKQYVLRNPGLHSKSGVINWAEGEGFKPPIPEKGIPDFESSAIVHSANLPV